MLSSWNLIIFLIWKRKIKTAKIESIKNQFYNYIRDCIIEEKGKKIGSTAVMAEIRIGYV